MPVRLSLVVLALVAVTGCATTQLASSWRNPQVARVNASKVFALALVNQESMRRSMEDAMVARLRAAGTDAVAGYTIVPQAEAADAEAGKAKLLAQGFDTAVVMRLVGTDQQTTYVPGTTTVVGPYYRSMWGYWGYYGRVAYDPGYLRTDQVVKVETLVYLLKEDTMAWSGLSKTTNPSSASSLVGEIGKAAAADMRKQGLLR